MKNLFLGMALGFAVVGGAAMFGVLVSISMRTL